MNEYNEVKFKVSEVTRGTIKLTDGSVLIFRVAVVDILVVKEKGAFNVEFEPKIISGVSVHPSEEVIKAIIDKPILPPGEKYPDDGWEQVEIEEKENSTEKVIYTDSRIGTYEIKVETEPTMVAINKKVKTANNEPLYIVRWVPKVTWKKINVEEAS